MEQQHKTLKWGDIVRIHGVNKSKKKETKGLIISKGFTDANIYYQLYEDFSEVNFYRESLFQILPRSNFDMHDQLLDEEISQEEKQNIRNRSHNEIAALESQLQSKVGKQIKFGSECVFRHVESKSYLQGMLKAADTGEGAFKIQVTDTLSSFVVFKINSHRSYENQNDKVYYDDSLQIYHPKSDTYMNFDEKEEPVALDIQEALQEIPESHPCRVFSDLRPSIKRPQNFRIAIINENKSKCLWKFIQHCTAEEYSNKEKIKSHDIVYFKHTKKDEESLISTSISEPIKSYLKENPNSSLSYECFWELIPKEVNQFGPEECNAFWARSIVTGKLLNFEDFNVEIQKNGMNGGEEGQGQGEGEQKANSSGYDNNGLINLICSEPDEEGQTPPSKLQRGQEFPQQEDIEAIVKEYEDKFKKINFKSVKILPKDIFMICKVEEEIMLDAQYVLSSHEPLIKFVEKLSSLLIHQAQEGFDYVQFFLSLNEDSLANIINILMLLAGRIYGTTFDNIAASGNTPNKNVQKVLVETGITQILMQTIYCLYEPFKFIEKNDQPSEDRAIRLKISKIFELTYQLLQKIAAGSEENRLYLSRWVDIFLEHSNGANKNYIQECLVGILQNNPKSIQLTITQQKIVGLIDAFLTEARQIEKNPKVHLTTKYLRLFSTFIICENGVIKENQNIILEKFFKNPKNEFAFRIKNQQKQFSTNLIAEEDDPFKIRSKQTQVAFGKGEYVSIPEFFEKYSNKWNYFLAYIDLLADVCSQRNNAAIQSVSTLISLQSVAVLLFDPDVANINNKIKEINQVNLQETGVLLYPIENIQAPFVRIAHHVYVNNEKFQTIKRIKKISNWYRSEDREIIVEDINRTKRTFEGEKEEEQERHLQSLLEYIITYIKNCNQQVRNLDMLLIVLNLLKETIILGLWKSIKFFRELSQLLVRKIAKIQSDVFFMLTEAGPGAPKSVKDLVIHNKEKLKLNRPEIAKSIQCKVMATEIFRYMNELEIDIRLRYVMNFFKGLYETTEDFNVYDKPVEEEGLGDEVEEVIKVRNDRAMEQYMKMDGKALFGDSIPKVTEDVDVLLKQNLWYQKLQQLTPFRYSQTDDPMKDRFMFQKEDMNSLEEEQREEYFNNLVLALFQLPIYQNCKLLNSSLNMLRTMFEQRKNLLDNFNKILICGKGNMHEVYITLKFMRSKFKMLTNSNILKYSGDSDKNFTYEIKKHYDYLVKDREKRSGIIEDLFFLARTLKDGISLKNIESLMFVDEDAFIPDQVYTFIDEREKNNQLFQSLNLAEGIYIPLIEYIQIVGSMSPLPNIHRKLLLSVYQYLTMLCFNNLEAKQILMEYIPFILPHLPKRVGAAAFLYEVTRNNKLLVSNESMVTLIVEKALQSCVDLDQNFAFENFLAGDNFLDNVLTSQNSYERSRILFALRGIILYNDRGHKENQQLLMNRLQDMKYNKLIFQGKFQFKQKISNFNLKPEEAYLTHHFELFSLLVESGNLINIGKLENIHPYHYCLECLEKTNRWQLRRAIRAYINRLYYVNKDKDIFLFEKFIRTEFDILNKELSELVTLYKSRLLTNELKIKNGIRFTYAQSQIFLFIIECLITLHEMFLKPQFLAILSRQLSKEERKAESERPLHEKIIQLFKYLGCLKRIYENTKIIDPFIKEIKRLMMKELIKMQIRYLEKKSEPQDGVIAAITDEAEEDAEMKQPAKEEKKNYVYDHSKSFFRNLHQMISFLNEKQKLDELKTKFSNQKNRVNVSEEEMKNDYLQTIFSVANQKLRKYYIKRPVSKPLQYDPHLQTAQSRIFKVLAKPAFNQNAENIQLNAKLTSVKKLIQDSPIFDKFKDDEFIFLVNKAMQLNTTSQNLYSGQWQEMKESPKPVIDLHEIIQQVFKLVMEYPDQIDDREKIFVIKLVRFYITEAIEEKQTYKLPVDKWDADYCGDNEEQFQRRQINVEQCGGSDFIISILKENLTGRAQLLNEALLLGIAYLFGGNPVCQNSILNSLKKDPENLMLLSMRSLIKFIGDFLINVRKIKQNEKVRVFNYNIVDTYDYFSMQDKMIVKYFGQTKLDKFEIQTQLNYEKALCRIFRFLQLFAQNNNKEMKMFLSLQINEDKNKKTNSINFIDEACMLLKKLFKVMNYKLVMLPGSLLGFIGEITQVPILSNQISFMKSTFFEDISYMASFFDSPENKLLRKFNLVADSDDDPLNSLSEIYQQGVQMALSNFEGNDYIIIKEFLNKCQPKFLWLTTRNHLWNLIKEKYAHMDFVVYDDSNDYDSMIKTFRNLSEKNFLAIISEEKKNENFDGPIVSIIEIYIIFKKIADYEAIKSQQALADKQNPNIQDSADAQKAGQFRRQYKALGKAQCPAFQKLFDHLNDLIKQIQINCENGQTDKLQFIYFPNHPVFAYLAGDTRDSIMMKVQRETSRDKLISLLDFRQEVYMQIASNYKQDHEGGFNILGTFYPMSITSEYYTRIRNYARNLSYIICLVMFYMIFVEHDMESSSSEFTYRRTYEKFVIKILCAGQLSLSVFFFFLWYNMRGEIAVWKYKLESESEEGEPEEEEALQKPQKVISKEYLIYCGLLVYQKILKVSSVIKGYFYRSKIYNSVLLPMYSIFQYQPEFLSIFLFLFTAFLGNFSGVQWYTVHLFDFFVGIPMLANVFKSIIENIQVLFIMSLLSVVFVLVFNVLSLSTYVPVIYEDQLPEESCEDILNCVLTVYTSGAIGDDMEQFVFGRFIFDIIYVVFMELLFQNLVGGIMIDGYSALIAQDDERDQDKKGNCYICSKKKANIEKQGTTFKKHTENKHFLWNYLFYIYCLSHKDATDYTGIQYIVSNKIQSEDVTWFPALGESDSGSQIEDLMKQLKDKVNTMAEKEKQAIEKANRAFQECNRTLKKKKPLEMITEE